MSAESTLPPVPASVHWDDVYARSADQWNWFEAAPTRSLEAILEVEPRLDAAIVDVGGGDARLADLLLSRGYRALTVVDVSWRALRLSQARLGEAADLVAWVEDDVGAALPEGEGLVWPSASYAVWHDRAVFHFLTSPAQQEAYLARLAAAVGHGGHAIIATFDAHGPESCSGLPVVRRSLDDLGRLLSEDVFELKSATRLTHMTPGGQSQPLVRCTWQRIG